LGNNKGFDADQVLRSNIQLAYLATNLHCETRKRAARARNCTAQRRTDTYASIERLIEIEQAGQRWRGIRSEVQCTRICCRRSTQIDARDFRPALSRDRLSSRYRSIQGSGF